MLVPLPGVKIVKFTKSVYFLYSSPTPISLSVFFAIVIKYFDLSLIETI